MRNKICEEDQPNSMLWVDSLTKLVFTNHWLFTTESQRTQLSVIPFAAGQVSLEWTL